MSRNLALALPLAGVVLTAPLALSAAAAPLWRAAPLSFEVTTTADAHDAHPGDGRCADREGRCTLRAATEEAAAQPPGTAVSIAVPAGTYRLTLGQPRLRRRPRLGDGCRGARDGDRGHREVPGA